MGKRRAGLESTSSTETHVITHWISASLKSMQKPTSSDGKSKMHGPDVSPAQLKHCCGVGVAVGESDGASVGRSVGASVDGDCVGASDGASVGHVPPGPTWYE